MWKLKEYPESLLMAAYNDLLIKVSSSIYYSIHGGIIAKGSDGYANGEGT
jgi:hypothetical protein